MTIQRDAIIPVLKMIHIVSVAPKFVESGMQTECSIGCHMSHILTQVEASEISDFAETSM
jgi:hypothetical protein